MEKDPYTLVNLQQKVVDGTMSKNLMGIIAKNNVDYGGLIETKMINKLVYFGVDCTTFF